MSEWAMVPKEPTEEIIDAFYEVGYEPTAQEAWEAMLAAAPSQEWVKTSERLPTRDDADERQEVWALIKRNGRVRLEHFQLVPKLGYYRYWMPKPLDQPPSPPEGE